jgi:hypothetical protein
MAEAQGREQVLGLARNTMIKNSVLKQLTELDSKPPKAESIERTGQNRKNHEKAENSVKIAIL